MTCRPRRNRIPTCRAAGRPASAPTTPSASACRPGSEVRHTDYGTKKVDANLWGEFYKQKLSEDSIRIGLNYTF
ncbi:MAG: hypothetical protein IPO00_17750 [Betaproteobacteria bacterium]|nr:hypothetical protein [Betaproteobacteria bacterium]